ncbi:hypothetical protein [Halobaculum litoreum]|nr:hypothetical protein [Halobaculum sp. DT92]
MPSDPDRLLRAGLVVVAALGLASIGVLGYVAATAGDADDAAPMRAVEWGSTA